MPRTASAQILKDATSRDFSGGLNVSDSELNLSSKYARVLSNVVVGIDGSLEVRQGTKLFSDIAPVSAYNIVNGRYFVTYNIVMNARGELVAVNGQGIPVSIWNPVIASAKRPGLTIWPGSGFPTFEEFNGELIVGNLTDKPLRVTAALDVDYLADLGSGSNINVPIGNVMAGFSQHFCIANGYMLNVSELKAAGTWLGDAGVQFANNFDMRPFVTSGDTTIIGLYPFKSFLLVCFREVIVPVQFVENASATPKLALNVAEDSIIKNYGAISQRTAQDIGDLILSADISGVQSQALSTFTKILSPDRPSRFVDPILQPAINKLSLQTLSQKVFSAYDRRLSNYVLFVPDANAPLQTRTTGFAYRYIPNLKIYAWCLFEGWNWCCAMRSSEGNIFYARQDSTKLFVQGDAKTNPLNRDYIGEQEPWSDGTVFTDGTGWTPVSDVRNSGVPIHWIWELPESDFRHRALSKTLRYTILDTQGDQQFTMSIFVDEMYQSPNYGDAWSDGTYFTDGFGFLPNSQDLLTPALQIDWIAGNAPGYGVQSYGTSPFGSGNNTKQRSMTETPTKFVTTKMRMEGDATGPLRFIAITALYQLGTVRRLP